MVVETRLDHSMKICRNTPRCYRVNIKAGGEIPHQITPFSFGRNGPNNPTIVMFESMASTSNTYDESQPSTHGDMGRGSA